MAQHTDLNAAVKTSEPACVAYLPMTGSYAQIPTAFGRLFGWIAAHGLRPGGMPSGVYLTDPASPDEPRWELRAPLSGDHPDAPPDAAGCGIKHLPQQLVASTMYRGPYERVAPVYGRLVAWLAAQGYAVAGPPEEVYFSEPGTPPEETLTEIRFPVARP